MPSKLKTAANIIVLLSCSLASTDCLAERPNVLLIAVDDMNDWLSCMGGHPDARSPHIDRLASLGTLFTNAHCQAPICNPSRTSIMYGIRPSTSGVYGNKQTPWKAPRLRDRPTIPAHFRSNGYETFTTGKIYHGSKLPPNDFQVVGPRPGQRLKIDKRIVPPSKAGASGLWDFGPQNYPEEEFCDHVVATWAIDRIKQHAAKESNTQKPFFIAAGLYRPHVPLYSPARVFNQIPRSEVDLPVVKLDDRDDLPPIVDKVTIPPVAPKHEWFLKSGHWRDAVQAYLSCIRFTDEQVGRLLTTLEETGLIENTIVVLYSDHGFFLGEKQRWAKQSLWEQATRVPLIIAAPGFRPALCDRPVELLSIFPTLIELCELTTLDGLEGSSVAQLLHDANADWEQNAVTTHGQNNHAVRTMTHRYIRYRDGSEELYDSQNDPREWNNLANDRKYIDLKAQLGTYLPKVNATAAAP